MRCIQRVTNPTSYNNYFDVSSDFLVVSSRRHRRRVPCMPLLKLLRRLLRLLRRLLLSMPSFTFHNIQYEIVCVLVFFCSFSFFLYLGDFFPHLNFLRFVPLIPPACRFPELLYACHFAFLSLQVIFMFHD